MIVILVMSVVIMLILVLVMIGVIAVYRMRTTAMVMMMVMMCTMLSASVMIVVMTVKPATHRFVGPMAVVVMGGIVHSLASSTLADSWFLALAPSSFGLFKKPAALRLILTPLPIFLFVRSDQGHGFLPKYVLILAEQTEPVFFVVNASALVVLLLGLSVLCCFGVLGGFGATATWSGRGQLTPGGARHRS